MRTRQQIHPFLAPELRKRLVLYASKRGLSQSSVVETAITSHLDAEVTDRALILRRLDRLVRESTKHQRDSEILSQAFGVFVKLWFAQTPRLSNDAKPGAEQHSRRRYEQFTGHVATLVASGRAFADDFLPAKSAEGSDTAEGRPTP